MSREVQLGWAGLILAVIGIILSVVGLVRESVGIAIIGLSLFVIVIGALSLLYKAQEQLNSSVGQLNEIRRSLEASPFTTLNVKRTLTFKDALAHEAEYIDHRHIQVNHKGISEYWFRELAPPEQMHDKLIDGDKPYDEKQELGLIRLCKRFPRNLSHGEDFESTLTATYVDAFSDSTDFFVHSIMDPIEKLRLEINLHNPSNLRQRSFAPLLKRAGLPHMRFHDLRHTCATLLLSRGVHPKFVQELLGHATIAITLDTYSHVIPSMGDATAKAMEDALA